MTDDKLKIEVNNALDRAELIWKKVERKLVMMSEGGLIRDGLERSLPSDLPDHPMVNPIKPEVDDFIAFVLDIRNSSKHLNEAIGKPAKATQLERVLYEVTAVNTIGCIIIEEKKGKITEFLGDGFLALYKVSNENKSNVYNAHNAAKECMRVVKDVVNPILWERYNLPPLEIGIGLAYSKVIITVVGYGDNLHPKALGECVFRASKMSDGINEIHIDDRLKVFWPSTKEGTLRFSLLGGRGLGFTEYTIQTKK